MIFTQQLGGLGLIALPSAAPASGVTWNPATAGAGVSFSVGNRAAQAVTPGGGYGNVRSTVSKTAGKWYFEVTINTIGSGFLPAIGVSRILPASDNTELGAPTGGYGLRVNGDLYRSGTYVGSWTSSFSVGNVMMVAFDMTAGLLWFGKNGTWLNSGNPAAGTGQAASGLTGAQMAGMSTGTSGSLGKGTANFAASDFVYSPPAGFSALS